MIRLLKVYSTYVQARDAFRDDCKAYGYAVKHREIHGLKIRLIDNSEIIYKSINNDHDLLTLQGVRLTEIYYDEISKVSEKTISFLSSRIRNEA